MTNMDGSARELVERMLAGIGEGDWTIAGDRRSFTVSIGGDAVAIDGGSRRLGIAFEKLAALVEARIAHRRAVVMLAAAPPSPTLPLWLVSGSDVLARWLTWSGSANALSRSLTLSGSSGTAPVHGDLARRARRELGQGAARIRVRQGMATAERIDLSEKPAAIATLGADARIRIEASTLSETLLAALRDEPSRNARRSLSEVVDHPFFLAADVRMIGVMNEGTDVVFAIESHWAPLAPVPSVVWATLPRDADPVFPWRATASEVQEHDRIVGIARRLTEGP